MIYLIATIAALTGFLFGFDQGIMSGVLDEIQKDFGINANQTGFMVGLLPFGALLSACMAGRFADWMGRVRLLTLVPIVFSFAIFMIILTTSYDLLCFARFLLGVSIGVSVVVSPLYIAETAPSEIRGKLVTCFQLAITIGIFCSYLVNLLASDRMPWRWMFATGLVPSTLLFLGAFFLPESPRWLCVRGRVKEATQSLCRLYGFQKHSARVDRELEEIQGSIRKEAKKNMWKELFSRRVRPVLLLGAALFFFQQLSGINVVIYYAPIIFQKIQLGDKMATLLATVGIGALNVLMTLVAMRWVEKMGRRPLLILGFIGTAIALFVVAFTTYLDIPQAGWISALCLFVFIAFFAVSLGPLPWVMMPEIFPLKVRGQGSSVSAASNWAFNTLVVATFPVLLHGIGISLTFLLYAVACVLGVLFSVRYVPETKNLSLEEIEKHVLSGKRLRQLGIK